MPKRTSAKAATPPRASARQQSRAPVQPRASFASRHPVVVVAAGGALLCLALYGRVLAAPFVYDDLDQVVNNTALLSWHALAVRFLTHPVALTTNFRGLGGLTYRPLFWLSLALDRQLWGLNPFGFHLTNLLLHIADGVLLFAVLRRAAIPMRAAGAASLLWLALPINVEVIAWVSARSYSLAALFALLGVLAALHFAQRPRLGALLASVVCFAAALLSNEIGVLTLPLAALLLARRRTPWRPMLPLLGAAAGLTLVGWALLGHALGIRQTFSKASFALIGSTFWRYAGWVLAPVHMSVERSTSVPSSGHPLAEALAWVALLCAAGLAAWLWRRRAPLVGLGLAVLILCLLPFCGVPYLYQGMAERFTYLASMGLALAVVGLVVAIPPSARTAGLVLATLWVAWGAGRGLERAGDWVHPAALYQHSLEATPHSASLAFNLGYTLKETGDLSGAETAFLHALALRPDYPHVYASLGDVYLAEGRWHAAQEMYAVALAADPADYATLLNSATAFARSGALALAEQQNRRAISLAPGESGAYTNLGVLLLQQNRADEAKAMLQKAIAARSTDPTPYFDLAVLYQRAGRPDLALPLYRKVLALKPNDPDTIANLAAMR